MTGEVAPIIVREIQCNGVRLRPTEPIHFSVGHYRAGLFALNIEFCISERAQTRQELEQAITFRLWDGFNRASRLVERFTEEPL